MIGSKSLGILHHPGYNDIGSVIGGVFGLLGANEQADATSDAAGASAAAAKYAADVQKQIYEQTRADQEPWRQTGQASLNMLANYMGLPSQYAQYYGMNDRQLRSALKPDFTTTNQLLGSAGQQRVDQTGLANEMERIRLGLQGYNPNDPNRGSLMKTFGMSDFQTDPGYGFRLSEGMKALERSAAARGGLLSGATMKGMERYGQDLASQEYQNAFNRYQSNQANQYNRLASLAGVGQTANQALQTAGSNYAGNVGNLAMTNAANQGNAALAAGQARASAYGGIGGALGNVNWGNIFGGQANPPTGFGYGEPQDWGVGAYNN